MKEKINLKSIIVGLIVLIFGIILILLDLFAIRTQSHLWISIGCSLIASALVIILTDLVVDRKKENPLEPWGMQKVYSTRAKMNEDCAVSLEKAKKQVDIIAFGLKSYRTQQDRTTKKLLQRGVNFRIITMNPDSPFVLQREKEEGEVEGQIKHTINELITWAQKMNNHDWKGKIEIKSYDMMTLDFYWRVDDDIYMGPYWIGRSSQATVSYKYHGGTGFDLYSDYFETLWQDENLTQNIV